MKFTTTFAVFAWLFACGGQSENREIAVFSNPELTIPQADGFAEFWMEYPYGPA